MLVFQVLRWTNIFNHVEPDKWYCGDGTDDLGLFLTEEQARCYIDEISKKDIATAFDAGNEAWIGAEKPEMVTEGDWHYEHEHEYEVKSTLLYEKSTGDYTKCVYSIRPRKVGGAA